MTYPTDHGASTHGSGSAETSTNSLAPCTPPLYQDPPPVHDLEKGRQPDEDKDGEEDDDHTPEVASQSSPTVTLTTRAKHFSDTFLERIPYGVAHFLGHRREEPKPVHPGVAIFWAFVGVLSSLLLVTLATERIPAFRDNGSPVIIASFGAAAVLEFNSIASPLAQPRNAIVSQIIASIVGVCISKLFAMAPNDDSIRWVGGALSCAIATASMAATNNIHPPAGATALIAVVDVPSRKLGWLMIPLVLLSSAIMMVVALILNNVQRRFPLYWWSPRNPPKGKGKESNALAGVRRKKGIMGCILRK